MNATITIHALLVGLFWIGGIVTAIADVLYPPNLGGFTVVFIGSGMTLFIKGYLDRGRTEWLAAYEAGREVTQLRQTR